MTDDRPADGRAGSRQVFWDLHDRGTYSCPGCGRDAEEVSSVHIHHRDGNKHNDSRHNLVGLCHLCHLGGRHDLELEDPRLTKPSPSGLDEPTVNAGPPSADF